MSNWTSGALDEMPTKQGETEAGRAEAVIVRPRSALADGIRSPVVRHESVDHDCHCDEGEHCCADLADLVAKVEQTDGEAGEDDGEVEP